MLSVLHTQYLFAVQEFKRHGISLKIVTSIIYNPIENNVEII